MRWNSIVFGVLLVVSGIYGIVMGLTDFSRQWIGEMFWLRRLFKSIIPESLRKFIMKMYIIGGIIFIALGILFIIYFGLD